jgi:DNA-binding NtrC family response regulator
MYDEADLESLDIDALTVVDNTMQPEYDNRRTHFPVDGFDLKSYMSKIELKIIHEALENSGGVIAQAAKSLGLRRTTLAEKMRKYQIDRSQKASTTSC